MHLWILLLVKLYYCQNLYLDKKIYQGVSGLPCIRQLNQQVGATGSTAGFKGTSGVLFQISDSSDLERFLSGTLNSQYAIVMPASMLNP